MISLETGDARDVAAIMRVMDDAFDPAYGEAWTSAQCLSVLTLPGSQLLVAKDQNGTVAGFTMTRWVLDEEELLMIGVSREWRRRKVANSLLQEILNRARTAGRTRLFLEVREENDAIIFYRKSGFVPIGRRKHYYLGLDNQRHDAITMAITIAH